jgi:hypothetical protein
MKNEDSLSISKNTSVYHVRGCIKLYAYLTKVLALRNENPGSLLPVKPHTE